MLKHRGIREWNIIYKDYKVHIIEEVSNPITLNIQKKIGTSYINLEVQANSREGNYVRN